MQVGGHTCATLELEQAQEAESVSEQASIAYEVLYVIEKGNNASVLLVPTSALDKLL